jgi:thioredoxin-like negative regulator of GroEL
VSEKVDFLFFLPNEPIFGSDLYNAIVSTLDLEEAVELLPKVLQQAPERRAKVATRIAKLITSSGLTREVDILIDSLTEQSTNLKLRRKVLYPMRIIVDAAPQEKIKRVICILIRNGDLSSLDQASYLMRNHWEDGYLQLLEEIPIVRHTTRSLSLLISKTSAAFLLTHLKDIANLDKNMFRRCVARMTELPSQVIEMAKEFGACEQLYAMFKTDHKPNIDEARRLLFASFSEADYRLALWCIGRFGYFDLLREAYDKRVILQSQIVKRLRIDMG